MTSISAKNALTNNKSYRLAVLLVTSNTSNTTQPTVIGDSKPSFRNSEFVNCIELLSASNFDFDIIKAEEISHGLIVEDNTIKYVAIIMTCPLSSLSDIQLSTLEKISRDYGVSVIATYTHADERSKSLFGIRSFRGKNYLWPLKVKIVRWPRDICENETVVNYGVGSGLTGYRKRGLRKLSLKQTFVKGVKHLRGSFLPYASMKLEPKTHILATSMNGKPIAWSYPFGEATNYYFALHGALLLEKFNEMHRLYRAVIQVNSSFGMLSADLENAIVLRLDDPGACSSDYLNTGGILEKDEWEELGSLLEKKEIPLSVMYTPGWVDDGELKAGRLFIDNQEVTNRIPGKVYESASVRYVNSNSESTNYDHSSEFRSLKKLVEAGHVDIHSHGLTHLDPDHQTWVRASDRRTNSNWYHEFSHVPSKRRVHSDHQRQAMLKSRKKIKNLFGVPPCALTPSGHKHDSDCDLLAYEAGYSIFSADFTGLRKDNVLIRNWKIPSIFLYLKDPSPFASKSGYPLILVAHDYEIKKKGLGEFVKLLNKFEGMGVSRFISMRELSLSLNAKIKQEYVKTESRLNIVISLPVHHRDRSFMLGFCNEELVLRLVLPENMRLLERRSSISGATLLSFKTSNNSPVITMRLRSENEPIITIDLPLEPF